MRPRLQETTIELVIVFAIGSLIGTLVALTANAYVGGVQWFTALREGTQVFAVTLGDTTYSLTSVFFLWAAAALVILIRRSFGITRWAGPADSIFAAQQHKEPLNVKLGLGSTLAAFTSAAGGGSVGQYGPLVHFGATLGVALRRFVPCRLTPDIYLGCGVAAAISAGFNAPLAGIIFAHEAMLRHFSVRAIAPISVASVAASTISSVLFPSSQTFLIDVPAPGLITLVPVLIITAPLIALAAIAYMVTLRKTQQFAAKTGWSAERLILTAATVCGGVGIVLPEILGLGIGTMNGILDARYALGMLIILLVMKIAMTGLCIGFGLFGGIFSPALFVGVATGAVIGQLALIVGLPDLSAALSVAAMAAVAAAVIGAPIASVLIVLELTQSYAYAVGALIAVMAVMLLTHRLFGHSYFDRQLLDRGIDLAQGREALALSQHTVAEHVSGDAIRLTAVTHGDAALAAMKQAQQTEAYVVDETGELLAKVSVHHAIEAGNTPCLLVADKEPLTLTETDSLADAMHRLSAFVGESIPILAPESRRLIGVITEGDLFQAVLSVQSAIRQEERS
ncbi:MAG: chloride channel protein [Gammaproteobacteria bacterium]|nr:chloride channel protein [Gammaproteobacteria bacterium]